MGVINLPKVGRPAPLRAAPRQTSFGGEAALSAAKNQTANTAMKLGGMALEMLAKRGQAEYNENLVKFKTAEMEEMSKLQQNPLEYSPDEETGTSHDDISKQSANEAMMRALPNSDHMRKWRKEYMDGEVAPGMKSKEAIRALKLKIDADSIETDKKLMDFDHTKNKERLADSYNEKANLYIEGGGRDGYKETIQEAHALGIYDAKQTDDIIDSGFALMQQNDVIGAAMGEAFTENGYGNEKAGKDFISKNLSYEKYDGTDGKLIEAEVKKQYDQKFKDQRNMFTEEWDTYFADKEDEAAQMFVDGTLSNQWVVDAFKDIPGTKGAAKQKSWLGMVGRLNSGSEKDAPEIIPLEARIQVDKIKFNPNMTPAAKRNAMEEVGREFKLSTLAFKDEINTAKNIETNPEMLDAMATFDLKIKEVQELRGDEGYNEKTEKIALAMHKAHKGYMEGMAAAGEEKSQVLRQKAEQQLTENYESSMLNQKLLLAQVNMNIPSQSEAGLTVPVYKDYVKLKERNYMGLGYVEGAQDDIAKMHEYEERTFASQLGVDKGLITSKYIDKTGESIHYILGTATKDYAAKYNIYDKKDGQLKIITKAEMDPDGKTFLIKALNKETSTKDHPQWDVIKEVKRKELPRREEAANFGKQYERF